MNSDPFPLDATAGGLSVEACLRRIRELEARLEESEDTLDAIRRGDIDAVVVSDAADHRVYTLENADRPYRVLIEQIQEGAITLGPDGTVFYCNRRLAEMLGVPQERIIGQPLRVFVQPTDHAGFERLLRAAGGGGVRDELALRGPGGAAVPVSLSLSLLQDGNDQALVCGVLTDLTQQKDHLRELSDANARLIAEGAQREVVEEALRQAQKMEAIGQLTGGVAHDFNNLLTVIQSSVDLLKRPTLSEERRRRYVDAIASTAARAAKLTGQLLAFARRQALKPEVFDVVESVRTIGDMVGTLTGARISIETRAPDQPCFVNADASQFDTSLVNLVVNARDAMDGEGTLTVTVDTVARVPVPRAQPAVEGDFVAVSVADTGSGIAPGDVDKIFEPFFTTKGVGKGTGLGLSQVFGFVKQSGGDVAVSSALGRGTTFTLYLPRVAAPARETEPQTDPTRLVDGHGTCVLVVEDNADVGAFTTQTLDELGYRSVLAGDAEAALAALREDAGRFDVVFSDVVMPGMNGIDLAQDIRRRHPDLPVVLTSGYSHVLAQDGPHGFELLNKPYSIEQLSRVLTKAAHWRRLRRVLDA